MIYSIFYIKYYDLLCRTQVVYYLTLGIFCPILKQPIEIRANLTLTSLTGRLSSLNSIYYLVYVSSQDLKI